MINSVEDAQEYIDTVTKKLEELTKISIDAGLNTHASAFMGLAGLFNTSFDDVNVFVDFIQVQIELALAKMK